MYLHKACFATNVTIRCVKEQKGNIETLCKTVKFKP